MRGANANANNANARIIKWRLDKTFQSFTGRGLQFAQPIRTGALYSAQESTISQQALKMGVKVPGTKCSFWCERNIRGTNGTKREKYGEKYREKYSGVNAAFVPETFRISLHRGDTC